jgi:isopenicillin N synthase-like dioxygenase
MADAFKDAGFVYIKNHGVPQEIIDRVFSESIKFFARPQEQKDSISWTTPESNRGYTGHGREKVTNLRDKSAVGKLREAVPDLKESIEIGRDNDPEFPNRWLDGLDKEGEVFKEVMNEFFEICKNLHVVVMRSIGLGMGLEERFFDQYTDGGDNTLRLLHYPSVHKDVFSNKDQVRAGDHSDYGMAFRVVSSFELTILVGSITFLFQDECGGLQVLSPKGTFVNATPIPGTIVVNAGDVLARWSNDTIRSTRHRVVEPTAPSESEVYPARYSIAYFCNPNFEKFIDALPGTFEKEGKKYPGVNSREYLVQRLSVTY